LTKASQLISLINNSSRNTRWDIIMNLGASTR